MESIVRNVADLEVAQRRWLEDTLGQPLGDSQQVFIRVLTPGAPPDAFVKGRALADVQLLAERAADYRRQHGIPDDEADAALNEAMRHVRPGPSP
jgi:hypothetical protein